MKLREPHQHERPEVVEINPVRDLPGSVFMIKDAVWNIDNLHSTDHPGVCVHFAEAERRAALLQGTDSSNRIGRRPHVRVEPDGRNGLSKPTAFFLEVRQLRLHHVANLFPQRFLGTLNPRDLARLRTAIDVERRYPGSGR